jgi:hypothetical protein
MMILYMIPSESQLAVCSAIMEDNKPPLRVRMPPGVVFPEQLSAPHKAVTLVQALDAARIAVAAKISPQELTDWYYGDGTPERAAEIEQAMTPVYIRSVMWLVGYQDPTGVPPVPPDSDVLGPQRAQWPEIVSFIEELRGVVAEKQGRAERGEKVGRIGPRRVIGDWLRGDGRSKS